MHVTMGRSRRARTWTVACITVAATTLSGCGRVQDPLPSDRSAGSTATSAGPKPTSAGGATGSTASNPSSTASTTSAPPAPSTAPVTVAASPGTARYPLVDPKPFEDFDTLLSFRSPSGNIGCSLSVEAGSSDARCDIAGHTWPAPNRPVDCELDYGSGLSIGDGLAEFTCAGDTVLGSSHVLGYATSIRFGAFVCDSDESGVTCSNTGTRHGFFVSRATYRVF